MQIHVLVCLLSQTLTTKAFPKTLGCNYVIISQVLKVLSFFVFFGGGDYIQVITSFLSNSTNWSRLNSSSDTCCRKTLIVLYFLQCNSHCASHTAKHTVGAQYLPECVNECMSCIPQYHHYWVSEMKGGQECHMLPHLTSLTQCDPRVLYSQVWKGIYSLAPLSQHILSRDSFRCCWQENVYNQVRQKGHSYLRKGL